MAEPFDPYYVWLGIPPEDQPPHHYRLLGINLFERESRVIESAGDRQMMHLRTFQSGGHSAESQRLLNEIAKAKIALLNPQKKAAYDGQLKRALDARKPKPAAHPAQPAEAAPDQAAAVVTPTVAPQLVGVAQYKSARKSAPTTAAVRSGHCGSRGRRARVCRGLRRHREARGPAARRDGGRIIDGRSGPVLGAGQRVQ